MTDKEPGGLPQVNRTPASVLKKMAENEAAYPKQDCNECGAVLRIGFSSMGLAAIGTWTASILRSTRISAGSGRRTMRTTKKIGR